MRAYVLTFLSNKIAACYAFLICCMCLAYLLACVHILYIYFNHFFFFCFAAPRRCALHVAMHRSRSRCIYCLKTPYKHLIFRSRRKLSIGQNSVSKCSLMSSRNELGIALHLWKNLGTTLKSPLRYGALSWINLLSSTFFDTVFDDLLSAAVLLLYENVPDPVTASENS
jgi:hypothetical protein